jgi:hypothetical protein
MPSVREASEAIKRRDVPARRMLSIYHREAQDAAPTRPTPSPLRHSDVSDFPCWQRKNAVLTHGLTMNRRFFQALVTFAPVALASAMIAGAACDPKLDIVSTPGEAGPEGSAMMTDAPVQEPPPEAAPPEEAGPAEAGAEAGPKGHVVDGVNDFAPGEKFDTTSTKIDSSYHAYAAWDAKNLYFGMEGNDVAAGVANATNKWVMLYIGRDALPGTTTGLPYSTVQQPTLPFPASIHLRWKVSGDYTNVQQWNAAMTKWEDAALVPLTVFRQGKFVEMGVSRASLGSPSKIQVVMNMLIENGNDRTYAGVPKKAFTDGLDPDFAQYFEFDLTDLSKAPNTYLPK